MLFHCSLATPGSGLALYINTFACHFIEILSLATHSLEGSSLDNDPQSAQQAIHGGSQSPRHMFVAYNLFVTGTYRLV